MAQATLTREKTELPCVRGAACRSRALRQRALLMAAAETSQNAVLSRGETS